MSIYVNGSKWLIHDSAFKQNTTDCVDIGTDGTNIYSLDISDAAHNISGKTNVVTRVGLIFPKNYPIGLLNTEVGLLFMAYASSTYVGGLTNDEIMPISTSLADHDQLTKTCKGSWLPFPGTSNVLMELTYFGNIFNFYKYLPRNFPLEKLAASNFFTNNTCYIPKQINYLVNCLAPAGNGTFVITNLFEYTYTVTNINIHPFRNSAIPILTNRNFITDERFTMESNPIPAIALMWYTNRWPALAEIKSTPSYKQLSRSDWTGILQDSDARKKQQNSIKSTKRMIISVLLLTIAVLPVFVFMFTRMKRNKK